MAPLKKKRIQIRKFPVTQYQADALKQLCPPENITVSEWAENYRVLDSKTSALPGPWRNDKTPYLKEIMDELINYDTERIIFVKPTQVGGTEALQNMLGYVIQQDPSPTMIVYPTDILAKAYKEGYRKVAVTFDKFTKKGSLKDFKKHDNYYVAGPVGEFYEVSENGELKHES